jgi:hypothetical protein
MRTLVIPYCTPSHPIGLNGLTLPYTLYRVEGRGKDGEAERDLMLTIQVLCQNEHSSDSVLAVCWQCAGSVLAVCWQCTGSVLAVCWQCAGSVLTVCWQCAGSVLAVCWPCGGSVLAVCWQYAGSMLAVLFHSVAVDRMCMLTFYADATFNTRSQRYF